MFLLEKAILWIEGSYFSRKQWFEVKKKCVSGGFVSYKHAEDINWWTGVVWIIVMFLSADWTLLLTAPIHYKGAIGEQVM